LCASENFPTTNGKEKKGEVVSGGVEKEELVGVVFFFFFLFCGP
jgi:hypothetical protein